MLIFQAQRYVVFQVLRTSKVYVGDTPDKCKNSMKGIVLISNEYYIYELRRHARELVVPRGYDLHVYIYQYFWNKISAKKCLEYQCHTKGMCVIFCIICTMIWWMMKHWLKVIFDINLCVTVLIKGLLLYALVMLLTNRCFRRCEKVMIMHILC